MPYKDLARKKEYDQLHYKQNKEARCQAARVWYEKNARRMRALANARYTNDKKRKKAAVRAWCAKNPERVKAMKRAQQLRQYGLTQADFVVMSKVQRHRCLICDKIKPLVVDHCHTTGKVRGLLCGYCNRVLGTYEIEKALGRFEHYLETTK